MNHHFRYVCNYFLRTLFIETPVGSLSRWVKHKIGRSPWHRNEEYWDSELAGSLASYLEGIDVDNRNAIVRILIHRFAPETRSVLDLGCASGALLKSLSLDDIHLYVGVDISNYAIEQATTNYNSSDKQIPSANFYASDLCKFHPEPIFLFDMIVFNEVLFYLKVEEAVEQVERYAKFLSPKGMLCISMKKDPKSRAIYRRISKKFKWVHGMLYQEQPDGAKCHISINAKYPAILVGLFRVSQKG